MSAVDHPSHYNSGKIEVIDFIEDQKLDFHLGNAVKYICRAGKKNPEKLEEDLKKAIWYIERSLKNIIPEVKNDESQLHNYAFICYNCQEPNNFTTFHKTDHIGLSCVKCGHRNVGIGL